MTCIRDVNKIGLRFKPLEDPKGVAARALFLTTGLKRSDVPTLEAQRAAKEETKQQASVIVAPASPSDKVNVPEFVGSNLLDLKDAYYSVPVNPQHKKYLRFEFYEFTCLPNGLASAPRVSQKL